MNTPKSIQNIQSIRQRLRHNRRLNHNQKMMAEAAEFPKAQESLVSRILESMTCWLVTQRKPLEEVVPNRLIRWFLRWVFKKYGFACRDYDGRSYASIEFRGVFADESDAHWMANCAGGAVKPLPFNAALPEETCSYSTGEQVPQGEASQWYRKGVSLPFVAVPRESIDYRLAQLKSLESRLDTLGASLNGNGHKPEYQSTAANVASTHGKAV